MSGEVTFVTANTFEFDSRHRRAAEALAADGWSVTVVAMAGPDLPAEETRPGGIVVRRPPVDRTIVGWLPAGLRAPVARLAGLDEQAERLPAGGGPRAGLRRALEILAYRRRVRPWAAAAVAAAPGARLFVAKALVTLPVVAEAARRTGGRYVYDVADLHTESGRLARLPRPLKAYLRRRERAWIRGASATLAVTPAMAREVARRYGVPEPIVVMNARERWRPDEPLPRPSGLRGTGEAIPDGVDVVVYQGAFRPDQGIDVLLAAPHEPALAGRAVKAVCIGFGPLERTIRVAALEAPERVAVRAPVPSDELLAWIAGADVCFVGTPPTTLNQRLTTPNKLFEAVMAGVPVVVAGGTYTAGLVREHGLGVVVEPWTPASVAAAIRGLLEAPADERDERRRRIRAVALERLNWEVERERLLAAFRELR